MAYGQPRYDVAKRLPGFELRDYQPYVVAETEIEATHAGVVMSGMTKRQGTSRGELTSAQAAMSTRPSPEAVDDSPDSKGATDERR